MMSDLPRFVQFNEEGPREGFQIENKIYPLEQRARLIEMLADSGLTRIQVASFVSPRAVPTMADAEDLFMAVKRRAAVRYTGLWLNEQGFEKAASVPAVDIDPRLMFYTTDGFSIRNNNRSMAEFRDDQIRWLDLYQQRGLDLESVYIITAFGCNLGGDVPVSTLTEVVRFVLDLCARRGIEVPQIFLADTVGWANPESIKQRVGAVRDLAPNARIGLHLHDTRGLGPANFYAALQMGVDLFDASVAGLGGCPFAGHGDYVAAGNICTEDMVFMCHELGIETGIDLEKLIAAALYAEEIIGRQLAGRIMHSGSLARYRKRAD
jgi:hydroxymethylglutaryl-CoA lyase